MSMEPRYAELASQLLSRTLPEPPVPRAEDRLLAIRAVERAMRRKARRRLAMRAMALVAVAASMALYFVAQKPAKPIAVEPAPSAVAEIVRGSAVTIRDGQEQPLSTTVPVTAGDRIVARPSSNARIKLSTGTTLLVEEGGELTIVEQASNQVFSLSVGAMRAEVAKLTQGQRFVIRTPDAELEARGTSFRVARLRSDSCSGGLTTKLSVFEGRVVARRLEREVSVGPGQDWIADCEERVGVPMPDVTARGESSTAPSARPTSSTAPNRGLQPINDLYAEAMDAKSKGDKPRAIAALQRLETLYPSSPLAESATVERMKLLAPTNPKAAANVAKRYLAHYPDGFARNVAESIVVKSP